jgi:hypothetical protein
MNEWSWGSIFGQIQIGVCLADSLMAMQQEPIYIRSIFEFACVLQKGTTSRESFDATKYSHFLKKGTTLSFGCTILYHILFVDDIPVSLHIAMNHQCIGTLSH